MAIQTPVQMPPGNTPPAFPPPPSGGGFLPAQTPPPTGNTPKTPFWKPRKSVKWWAIASGGVAVLVIVGALAGNKNPAPIAATTSPTTVPSAAAPTVAPTADTTAAYASLVATDSTVLSTDLTQLSTDATTDNEPATSADCTTLITDTQSFLSDLGSFGSVPTGMTKTDSLLREGLGDYIAACTSVIAGITNQDSNAVQTGVTELTTANALIEQATAAIGS